jgi:CRP-like cAMP-binding protein
LWLRVLTVIGALCLLPYYYLQPEPLMVPIYWNLVFSAINLYWIARLLFERRPVKLDPDEQRLYQLAFRTLTPREAFNLFKLGTWKSPDSGVRLVDHGEAVDSLSVLLSGKATIKESGRVVAEIGEGQFVGAIASLTDNKVAPVDITTSEPSRMMTWPKAVLRKTIDKTPDLGIAIDMALGVDMARLLTESWKLQTPGHT